MLIKLRTGRFRLNKIDPQNSSLKAHFRSEGVARKVDPDETSQTRVQR
jgi:hypothetical protein